jgi:hypothetical protein
MVPRTKSSAKVPDALQGTSTLSTSAQAQGHGTYDRQRIVNGEDGPVVVSDLHFTEVGDKPFDARNVLEDVFERLRQSVKRHARMWHGPV